MQKPTLKTALLLGLLLFSGPSSSSKNSSRDLQAYLIDTNDILVNVDSTAAHQTYPRIATLVNGGYVIVWHTEYANPAAGNKDVFAQIYNEDDTRRGSPHFRVNTFTDDDQYNPAVAALPGGGFVVTWVSKGQRNGADIYAKMYDENGVIVKEEFPVNINAVGDQSDPEVTSLLDGSFVIVWQSFVTDFDVFGLKFSSNGDTIGSTDVLIPDETMFDQKFPSIVTLNNGRFVVIWTSDQIGDLSIYAKVFNNNFSLYGEEFSVPKESSVDLGDLRKPGLSSLTDGGFVIVWENTGSSLEMNPSIRSLRYGADGSEVTGGELIVNTHLDPSKNKFAPTACLLNGEGYIIAWESQLQDSFNSDAIYAQLYKAEDVRRGVEFQINLYEPDFQRSPKLAPFEYGFIAVWVSNGQDGDQGGIYKKKFYLSCPESHPLSQNLLCYSTCPLQAPLQFKNQCYSACPVEAPNPKRGMCYPTCPTQAPYHHLDQCYATCPSAFPFILENICMESCPSDAPNAYQSRCYITCPEEASFLYQNSCSKTNIEQATRIASMVNTVGAVASSSMKAVNLFMSSSPASMTTSSLNKMLLYIRYLNISHSERLETLFQVTDLGSNEIVSLPEIPSLVQLSSAENPLPYAFSKYELSSSFVKNFGDSLFFLMLILGVLSLLKIMKYSLKWFRNIVVFRMIILKLDVMLQNFFIGLYYEGFGEIVFFAGLEMRTVSFSSGSSRFGILCAISCLLVGILILCFHVYLIHKYQRVKRKTSTSPSRSKENLELFKFKKKQEGVQLLFEEFKDTTFYDQCFLFFFVLRFILFNFMLTLLFEYPMLQICFIVLMNIAILVFLIIRRPLNSLLELVQQILMELTILVVNCSVLISAALDLTEESYLHLKEETSEVLIFINTIYAFLPLVFLVLRLAQQVYQLVQWYSKNRKRDVQKQHLIKAPRKRPVLGNLRDSGIKHSQGIDELEMTSLNSPERRLFSMRFRSPPAPQTNLSISLDNTNESIQSSDQNEKEESIIAIRQRRVIYQFKERLRKKRENME